MSRSRKPCREADFYQSHTLERRTRDEDIYFRGRGRSHANISSDSFLVASAYRILSTNTPALLRLHILSVQIHQRISALFVPVAKWKSCIRYAEHSKNSLTLFHTIQGIHHTYPNKSWEGDGYRITQLMWIDIGSSVWDRAGGREPRSILNEDWSWRGLFFCAVRATIYSSKHKACPLSVPSDRCICSRWLSADCGLCSI